MTTGKDYGLPDEYADWVLKKLEDGVDGAQSSFIRVTFERLDGIPGDRRAQLVMWAYLFPPKPRPTLPDVKPGAVLRFRQLGSTRTNRAVKTSRNGPWIVLADDGMNWTFTGSEMLATFDMESATVELDGLE